MCWERGLALKIYLLVHVLSRYYERLWVYVALSLVKPNDVHSDLTMTTEAVQSSSF